MYNAEKVNSSEAQSYQVVWDDKFKGHVGLIDQYLVSMGAISKASGNADAYDLSTEAFAELQQKMKLLRPRLSSIYTIPECFKLSQAGRFGSCLAVRIRRV